MNTEHKMLHQKFIRFGINAKEWMKKCVMLLPEIEKHRIWEQKGFSSIYEYAAKLAGMSRNTVNDALRILRKIEDKPELQKVVEMKGINAVRPILRIATPETAEFWAEKAAVMSKHTLEMYVRELRRQKEDGTLESLAFIDEANNEAAGQNLRTGTENIAKKPHQQAVGDFDQRTTPVQITITMELNPEIANQLQKLKASGNWNTLMRELLQIRAQKLEEEKPAPIKTKFRHIPAKIKKHVLAKTNGTCSFPGCTKPHEIFHHTQRWVLENIHDPNRLEPLCEGHERIAHLGLIENENLPTEHWQVRREADRADPKFQVDQLVMKYRLG